MTNLTDFFAQIPDPRRGQGLRYPLPAMLWMSFLAIASGYGGYRQISKFGKANAAFFTDYFALKHGVPSHVSVRTVLQALDPTTLAQAFNQHFSGPGQTQPGDWVAADGQSLCATVAQAQTSRQSFVSVVSLYSQRTGLTLALADYTDKKSGEMSVVRDLLPQLQNQGVVLTLDALHAPKKRPPLL